MLCDVAQGSSSSWMAFCEVATGRLHVLSVDSEAESPSGTGTRALDIVLPVRADPVRADPERELADALGFPAIASATSPLETLQLPRRKVEGGALPATDLNGLGGFLSHAMNLLMGVSSASYASLLNFSATAALLPRGKPRR